MLSVMVHQDEALHKSLQTELGHLPVQVEHFSADNTLGKEGIHITRFAENIPLSIRNSESICIAFEAKERCPDILLCGGEYPQAPSSLLRIINASLGTLGHTVPYEKLHALFDEVVSVGHHDFSEPARNIAFFADLLSKGGLSPERNADFLERTVIASQRLQSLIRDLTRYARIWLRPFEPETLQTHAIREIVEEAHARALLRVPQTKAQTLLFEGNGPLHIPARFLSRMAEELLANGLEHHEDSNTPLIFRLTLRDESATSEVEVIDDGPGITVPSGVSLFRPFYRNERNDELRTGIGLALVKSLCERAGGAVELIETEVPSRARLRLVFPIPSA